MLNPGNPKKLKILIVQLLLAQSLCGFGTCVICMVNCECSLSACNIGPETWALSSHSGQAYSVLGQPETAVVEASQLFIKKKVLVYHALDEMKAESFKTH
jgi:hypothetical protein